ncbi:MAG: hypothetical protein JWL62_3388, partial [Hyphomicrobiales bacterium]|nr:hypothetical protein [Hyphomicrobiales bacterium]
EEEVNAEGTRADRKVIAHEGATVMLDADEPDRDCAKPIKLRSVILRHKSSLMLERLGQSRADCLP